MTSVKTRKRSLGTGRHQIFAWNDGNGDVTNNRDEFAEKVEPLVVVKVLVNMK